jgi:hypothetical protein
MQQNPGQQNSNVQPGQAQQLRQNQDRDTNRSTFTQDRNNPANQGDRSQNLSREDRNQQAGDRPRSAMRPNDLRAPDIGLWFDRGTRDDLVISDIASRGAIAKIGFHEGDRIVSVNGHRIAREADFIQYLFGDGTTLVPVEVVITRDGRDETIQVDPSLLVADYDNAEQVDPVEQFGIVADDRYPDRIVVWRVIPRSPAYYAGFRQGDVITTFHDQPMTTLQAFQQSLTGANAGEVAVQVRRGDRTRDLSVDVPRFDQRGERHTAMRPNLDQRNSYDPKTTPPSDQSSATGADQQNDRANRDSSRDNGRRGLLRGSR